MGWNFRKSVNLGNGMRLNFSKSGVGISGGVKGLRVSTGPRGTRMTASIPGTGIYYTKTLSSPRGRTRRNTTNYSRNNSFETNTRYQFSQIVTNEYTGESRELRALSQFELNQLVTLERERQFINEQRQRLLDNAESRRQQVETMNQQIAVSRNEMQSIISNTLAVDDKFNWDEHMILAEYPPLDFKEKPPVTFKKYRLNFFKSLFMNEEKFEISERETSRMREYEERRDSAISEYLEGKEKFDSEKNKKNGELSFLRKRFEESDKEAVERYVSIVLTNSKYPVDFEHDFDVKYDRENKKLIVNFLFQDIDSFPITDRYEYNEKKDEIEEVLLKRETALAMYTDILYSVGVRTIHEVFESVYTDGVNTVCFNGYIENEDENQCAFALRAERESFEKIDLTQSLGVILSRIESKTIGDFTQLYVVTPFE